jgi:hypothetical protein
MPYASKPDCSTVWADAIFDFQMAALHSNFDPVAKKRKNATFADRGFAGKDGLR